MTDMENQLRAGEMAVAEPAHTDAGVYFIGTIRTPWRSRAECPKRGDPHGPVCQIIVNELWRCGLVGVAEHPRLQILYWMHQSRRDLVLQTPLRSMVTIGTFALRSPVRPNPIASSVVMLLSVDELTLHVRGLDCLDGTPLIDIKPDRSQAAAGTEPSR